MLSAKKPCLTPSGEIDVRVCIVGTSHIAALKLAETAYRPGGAAEFVFFGAPARKFQKVKVENGILCGDASIRNLLLQTSGGRYEAIDPAEFDAVVFHGIDLHPALAILSIARHGHGSKLFFSDAFLRQGIRNWVKRTKAFGFASSILRVKKTVVILSPTPCPAEGHEAVDGKVPKELMASLRPRILEMIDEVLRDEGIHYVSQPEETYGSAYYTKQEYTVGSVRLVDLGRQHPDDDFTHMNAAYGLIVLRRFENLLAHKHAALAANPPQPEERKALKVTAARMPKHGKRLPVSSSDR